MKATTASAMLALSVTMASAETDSANFWLPHCAATSVPPDKVGFAILIGECRGMLAALGFTAPRYGVCIPDDVTKGELRRVVIYYVTARPQRHHELFMTLAMEAMQQAWPCR